MSAMGALTSAQQLMEEELQQSVRESEENLEYGSSEDAPGEEDVDAEGEVCDDEDVGEDVGFNVRDEDMEDVAKESGGEKDSNDDGDASEDSDTESSTESAEESEEDLDAEADDNYDDAGAESDSVEVELPRIRVSQKESDDDGNGDEGDDQEVELDESDEGDDDGEGVGAVKLRPGQMDDEEDSEASIAESSRADSDANSEEAEWEDPMEDEDDGEESDVEPVVTCMFCKHDEDNRAGKGEPDIFLTCTECDQNAHQLCARENKAWKDKSTHKAWTCPECLEVSDNETPLHDESEHNERTVNAESPPATRRAAAPKLARDLLPSQRGAVKPDSHSVFSQLVLHDDPMDGSRVLRKRKTSSLDGEDLIAQMRKRRKNTGDSHSVDDDSVPAEEVEEENRPRSSRSLRLKISTHAPATIVKKTRSSLVVRLRVAPLELKKILSKKPKPPQRSGRRAAGARAVTTTNPRNGRRVASPPVAPFASNTSQPFYSFFDKDTDDKGKPYGGILTEAEADTSKTLPTNEDRRRFDEAKQEAEEDWKVRRIEMQAEIEVPLRKPRKSAGPASQIECIEFGGWEIDTWYAAPYPEEYSRNRVLFICEFCLKYMNSDYVAWRHKLKCPAKHPPGDEIYRSGSISVFEVDGRKNPVYCQNLCLLAKLFLGSKTLYYDVEPFLFYVLCEFDDLGYHFVGYFSKEKRASSQNNVSCILTLPIHQRKGYGNLLIDFSYLLTRVEEKCGSPEKPLSDMGLVSYRNYWRLVMCRYLISRTPEDRLEKRGLSIKQISDDTGMTADDVVSALEGLRALVRDPQSQLYAFRVDLEFCKQYVAKWESKNYVQLDPRALTWTPYVMGRSNATNFELAPAMHAIAPREEDEEQKMAETVLAEVMDNGQSVQIPVATSGHVGQEVVCTGDTTILESTEPNETGNVTIAAEDPQPELLDQGVEATMGTEEDTMSAAQIEADAETLDRARDSQEERHLVENAEAVVSEARRDQHKTVQTEDKENSWISGYRDIPPTRFTVFPSTHSGRRAPNRLPAIHRPSVPRTITASRPKARSTTRRIAVPKARSSASRNRKPGGTGRGPGRWPKGTKKSDYGNADSGPGLPPAWVERQRLATMVDGPQQDPEQPMEMSPGEVVDDKEHGASAMEMSSHKINGAGTRSGSSGRDSDDADADMRSPVVE